MSTTHRTHHQGDLGYPLPLPPIAGCTCHDFAHASTCPIHPALPPGTHARRDAEEETLEAEVAHARTYAGPEAADDAEVRVRWYAEAWGCPERETTCALARQAAELAAANAVPVIEESEEDYGNAEIARLMAEANREAVAAQDARRAEYSERNDTPLPRGVRG